MRDKAGTVVDHGEAEDTADIGFVEMALLGNIRKGNVAFQWDLGGDVKFVDGVQAGGIVLRLESARTD